MYEVGLLADRPADMLIRGIPVVTTLASSHKAPSRHPNHQMKLVMGES